MIARDQFAMGYVLQENHQYYGCKFSLRQGQEKKVQKETEC